MNPDSLQDACGAGQGSVRRWHVDLLAALLVAFLLFLMAMLVLYPRPHNAIPLILLAYAALRISYECTFNRRNVPTMASGFFERRQIAHILKQDADARGLVPYRVIDLGSGRGELARRIARTIPHADVIGLELSRLPFLQSQLVQRWFGPANLHYQCQDFFAYDCAAASAVVMYVSGKMTKEIGEKLARELQPGGLVLTCEFELLGKWQPIEKRVIYAPFRSVFYIYRQM